MIAEIAEFAIRAAATAFVVIGITLLVQHLGARVGGIVVGLPVVIGPGMYVLLGQHGAVFVSDAAISALFAIAASVCFAWTFARVAMRRSAWSSLAVGVAAWFAILTLLRLLPETFPFGLAAFAAAVVVTHLLGHDASADRIAPAAARRASDLILRGLAAGCLVGGVGLVAQHAGPNLSGVMLTFPITLAVVGVTLHQRHGGPIAARTLATTQISMTSIAAFVIALILLLEHLPPLSAFWLAVAASLVPAAVLTLSGSLWRPATESSRGGR